MLWLARDVAYAQRPADQQHPFEQGAAYREAIADEYDSIQPNTVRAN